MDFSLIKNLLVFSTSQDWIPMTKAAISSAYFNGKWQDDIMVIYHDKLNIEDINWFNQHKIITMNSNCYYNFSLCNECIVNKTNFADYKVFSDEFKKWKKIILMDSDIIIRKNINNLTNIKNIGAVKCNFKLIDGLHNINKYSEDFKKLQNEFDLEKIRFLGGLVVFDSKIINEQLRIKINDLSKKYLKLCQGEQSLLNLIFYNQFEEIPRTYYTMPISFTKKNIDESHILHFWGNHNRPWNKDNVFYTEWQYNLIRSEYVNILNNNENTNFNYFKKL